MIYAANCPKQETYDLTIVTVCFNAMPHLRRCIDSVQPLYHGGLSVEHIVIDGASRDGTAEFLAQELAENRISGYLSEPDEGIYDAMNKGIRHARGKVIVFINSDDEICADAVAACCAPILSGRTEYTASTALIVDDNDQIVKEELPDMGRVYLGVPYCHQSMYCSRELLLRYGGFRRDLFSIGADLDLMKRIFSGNIAYEIVSAASCRFHLGGVSSGNAVHMEMIRLMRQHKDALLTQARNDASIGLEAIRVIINLFSRYCRDTSLRFKLSDLDAAHELLCGIGEALPNGVLRKIHGSFLNEWRKSFILSLLLIGKNRSKRRVKSRTLQFALFCLKREIVRRKLTFNF